MAIAENLLCCVSVLWELPELGIHTWIFCLCGFLAARFGVQKPLGPIYTSFCHFSLKFFALSSEENSPLCFLNFKGVSYYYLILFCEIMPCYIFLCCRCWLPTFVFVFLNHWSVSFILLWFCFLLIRAARGMPCSSWVGSFLQMSLYPHSSDGSQNHRITESQNGRGWKGPLWVI